MVAPSGKGDSRPPEPEAIRRARIAMVRDQIEARGIRSPAVLRAMVEVPRHRFVPPTLESLAHDDRPLQIGEGQTISQPYMVATLCDLAGLDASSRVLDVGTGSGYQAAVLSRMAGRVYSVEVREGLVRRAVRVLTDLGYDNVFVRFGDGKEGWKEAAPFDAILVGAAASGIPDALVAQLAEGGRLLAPVGGRRQRLRVLERNGDRIRKRDLMEVRFVPLWEGGSL